MERMKLTPAQIDAINDALSHYGDADFLVKMHQNVINNGHEWSLWDALNELSVTALSHALKYGFEVEEQSPPNSWKHVHSNVVELPKAHSHPQYRCKVKKFQVSTKEELEADLDYQLVSLHDALDKGNQAEVECCKQRLAEIHKELEGDSNVI